MIGSLIQSMGVIMTCRLLTLSLLIVVAGGTSYAADNAVAPVDIADVSAVIVSIADGLYIESAFVFPTATTTTITSTSGETITLHQPFSEWANDNFLVANEETMILHGNTENHRIIALYPPERGATIILRTIKNTPPLLVWNLNVVGTQGESLLLYLRFAVDGTEAGMIEAIVRIFGDWESLGVDLSDNTPSADLNRDGKVDSLDLLLLQAQWDPK